MTYEPQNQLERSLIQSINDPAWRPQFYRDFAVSEIFTICPEPPGRSGDGMLQPGQGLPLVLYEKDGKEFVPIFSSLQRLQAAATGGAHFIAMNALAFLELAHGRNLVLNPGSPGWKEFTAAEAAAIADGSIWGSGSIQVNRPTRYEIGVPANYPMEFAESLKRLFAQKREITRAWLALVRFPDTGESQTMIGIDATREMPAIAAEIGVVAHASPVPNPPVTVMQVGLDGAPASMFSNIAPFYERR